jgi:hypothetical protein
MYDQHVPSYFAVVEKLLVMLSLTAHPMLRIVLFHMTLFLQLRPCLILEFLWGLVGINTIEIGETSTFTQFTQNPSLQEQTATLTANT